MALVLSRDMLAYLPDVDGLYNQVNALVGVETTILNHIVPVNEKHILVSVSIGGNDQGEFIIKINGSEELRIRNAWTDRTKEISLGQQVLDAGETFVLTVINNGNASNTFEARLNAKKM